MGKKHNSRGNTKPYTVEVNFCTDSIALLDGLNDAGFDIGVADVQSAPDKRRDHFFLIFQSGHHGKRAIKALENQYFDGKKLYIGGAQVHLCDEADERDRDNPVPEIDHIRDCVEKSYERRMYRKAGIPQDEYENMLAGGDIPAGTSMLDGKQPA